MKPYFRFKGKYSDGRRRLVVEYEEEGKIKSIAMGKPEEELDRLTRTKNKGEKATD